jgi:hypothetical protein
MFAVSFVDIFDFFCVSEKPMRTLRLMHDGISFDKIQPKQVGYFGT